MTDAAAADGRSPTNNVQRFGRAPGYPIFLAPLTWLDADLRAGRLPADVPAAVKIVQAMLGAAAILVLAGLVRRVAGDRPAVIAAWIAAVFPPLVWMPAYALSEQLYSLDRTGLRRLARHGDRRTGGGAPATPGPASPARSCSPAWPPASGR